MDSEVDPRTKLATGGIAACSLDYTRRARADFVDPVTLEVTSGARRQPWLTHPLERQDVARPCTSLTHEILVANEPPARSSQAFANMKCVVGPVSNRPKPDFLIGTSYLRDSLTPSLSAESPSPRAILTRSTWFASQRCDGDFGDGGSTAAYESGKHRIAMAVSARGRPQAMIFFTYSTSPRSWRRAFNPSYFIGRAERRGAGYERGSPSSARRSGWHAGARYRWPLRFPC